MHKFLTAHHVPLRILAEHSVLPVHLALAAHAVNVGILLSTLTVTAYLASTIYQHRAQQRVTTNA